MTPDDLTHIEKTQDERDAVAYWQNSLAKFFPTSKGPTSSEVDMFISGRKGMLHPQDADIRASFIAQEYADAAVKAERERCAQVVFDSKPGDTNGDVMKKILNPPKDEAK